MAGKSEKSTELRSIWILWLWCLFGLVPDGIQPVLLKAGAIHSCHSTVCWHHCVVYDDSLCYLSYETIFRDCTQRKFEDIVISFVFWMMDVDVLGEGIVKIVADNAGLVSHVDPLISTVSSLTIVPGHDLHVSAQGTRATTSTCPHRVHVPRYTLPRRV